MKKIKSRVTVLAAVITMLAALFLFGCEEENTPTGGQPSQYAGKLLILQAYGSSDTAKGASHSFVELYNNTDTAINLSGINLYYADGHNFEEGGFNLNADKDWKKIELEGQIPAKGSFLIMGAKESDAASYQIDDDYGDIVDENFSLSNRAFKVVLIEGNAAVTVQNPFNTDGKGTIISGYIDMVGAANEYDQVDTIYGFEGSPARCSASQAVRRKSLTDTNNNSEDFIAARYNGMSEFIKEVVYPRNSEEGDWDPFAIPNPPAGSSKLMILQANTFGNNNGISNGSPTGGGFARSLVELYNNTDSLIDLTSGNYYLHIGNATEWTNPIKLEGTIPAKSSFLIVSNTTPEVADTNINNTPRATLPTADQPADFVLVNNDFVVAILINQSSALTGNPFDDNDLTADYIDMLGCRNAVGKETEVAPQSRPQCPRRKTLDDTDNNKTDFAQADYRGRTSSSGIDDDQLYMFWPRNSSAGAWNPITGLPAVDPKVVPNAP